MTYRGDIDGLRALAVLSVVLFHFDYLDGGFVGVDIFFVISGFLITKLIDDAVNAGGFRITGFYIRRIRRIFPALFAVYAVTAIFAVTYCFSFEADFIGKTLLSSVFFVSNVFFLGHSGYFDGGTSVNPLLHTWSLSVEEQFYVVFPLLMLALSRFAVRIRHAVLGAVALVSFAASCVMAYADQPVAFYLMQYRGWEFLAGSLLAVGAVPAPASRRLAEYAGAAGLVLVVASIAIMSRKYPFPGHGALAPCLGAALIIYSGAAWPTRVSRFLSTPPMRFIGLISYSLYLWHYPVRIFYGHIWGKAGDGTKLALILISIALATLSWRFIERPFRAQREDSGGKLPVFGAAAASMAVLALISIQLGAAVRVVRQEPPQVAALLSHLDDGKGQSMREGICFLMASSNDLSAYQPSKCLEISPNKQDFLLIGDSHAAHLWPGFSQVFPQINFMQANASGCRPVFEPEGKSRCRKLMEYIFTQFLPGKKLDGIIMASRWRKDDIEDIKQTALRLRQYADRVIVFGPIVEYTMALPRILALEYAHLAGEGGVASYRKTYQQELDLELGRAMQAAGIEYVSVYRAICAPECSLWAEQDTVPMQFDYGHLTTAGAKELARRVKRQLFPDVAMQGGTGSTE